MTNQNRNNCETLNVSQGEANQKKLFTINKESADGLLPTEDRNPNQRSARPKHKGIMATAHLPIQKSKYHEHNGEPGCQGLDEVNRMFRNFWDPTAYWTCEKQGTRARLQRCPKSQLYSEELGRCVHYTEWSWTEPKEPPSRPKC